MEIENVLTVEELPEIVQLEVRKFQDRGWTIGRVTIRKYADSHFSYHVRMVNDLVYLNIRQDNFEDYHGKLELDFFDISDIRFAIKNNKDLRMNLGITMTL